MPTQRFDIATALQTAGLGTLGTNIFISTVLDDESRGYPAGARRRALRQPHQRRRP